MKPYLENTYNETLLYFKAVIVFTVLCCLRPPYMLGMVVHTIISATWETEAENPKFKASFGNLVRPYIKCPWDQSPEQKKKERKKISFITHTD